MSQNAAVRKMVLPSPPKKNPPKEKVKIDLHDRTTWTAGFCLAMQQYFSGDICSWWIRCQREIERYTRRKNNGEAVEHPLSLTGATGMNRVLTRTLTSKEAHVASQLNKLDKFEVSNS